MGKYMRKAKITGEVAVMEVSHQSSLGVCTRAKTLALQRLENSSPTADSSSCYLQLRNRRLEKPFAAAATATAKPKESCKENPCPEPSPSPCPTPKSKSPSPSPRVSVFWEFRFGGSAGENRFSGSVGSVSSKKSFRDEDVASEALPDNEGGVEVSFGENVLEIESRDRNIRETTPCSLIRDSETIGTPGSTTRPTNSTATNLRIQSAIRRNIPTAHEMEEFFASAERLQQRIFIEKYNYDPVNDCPLPGRYEWERLDS